MPDRYIPDGSQPIRVSPPTRAAKRYKAVAHRNRAQTWDVVDTHTGRVVLAAYPGDYAKAVARDCNADADSVWLR